jgi:alpha-amylase
MTFFKLSNFGTLGKFSKAVATAALAVGLTSFNVQEAQAQKVVLQGFWWDYWNNNYQNGWANYLSDLAPRLKAMGIDAVWIPPTIKNSNQGNGYSPFDHYDLGDKFQKNITKTRLGSKDELLRMVGVLHANGMDVIQDLVLNHVDGAGSATGAGGQDPAAWDDGTTLRYKNFRYTSFNSPAGNESATDYLNRKGRFSKNWQNFYPNPANTSTTGDWNSVFWGPDIAYDAGSFGQSSNATWNPTQSTNHMRNNTRSWAIWYKKQIGFDGLRIDAVKHFPNWAMEDFLANMQSQAGFANGSERMFAVGEFVGGKSQLDGWVASVQNRAGTFDFGLREGLLGMVNGNGFYNIGSLPSLQQDARVFFQGGQWVHRTVPFVNNHDTFRPILNPTTGNYTGWNTGSQLAPHIDPFTPYLSACYAVIMAVDGSPQVFFEDLFDVGGTGKRFTHLPTSAADLPVRSDIANLIWCHQNLRFKDGVYKVRFQAADHLVIERSGRAIISVNDNMNTWQNNWVQTDFAAGTVLKDYSGANGTATVTVNADKWVNINTPPCNGTANNGRRGYSVWAPVNAVTNFTMPERNTTQEWELDNDLGDSHASSLRQGGQTMANNNSDANARRVGSIYVQSGKPVSYVVTKGNASHQLVLQLFTATGTTPIHSFTTSGTGATGSGTYTPNFTGWVRVRIKNSLATSPAQKSWVRMTYTSPQVANARTTTPPTGRSENEGDTDVAIEAGSNVENSTELIVYPNPTVSNDISLMLNSDTEKAVNIKVLDIQGREVYTETRTLYVGTNDFKLPISTRLETGMYIIQVPEMGLTKKVALR